MRAASRAVCRLSRPSLILAAGLGAALLGPGPAPAQVGPVQLGTIEGTAMTRDEFRGRAMAQLCAIALNACAYHEAFGEYPADYAHLRASEAWNLEVSNMFDGGRLRDIFYDPASTAMTTAAVQGFIPVSEMPLPALPPENPAPSGPDEGAADGQTASGRELDIGGLRMLGELSAGIARVAPGQLKGYGAGELLYYAKDDLLQLVLYAPDGTYVEWVDEIPRPSFREALRLPAKGMNLPADLYCKQVLYYVSELLPEYYNLVRFMADQGELTPGELARRGAQERLAMAGELGIRVLNPLSRAAAAASADPAPGDLLNSGPPLGIRLLSGALASLEDLSGRLQMQPGTPPGTPDARPPKAPPGSGKPRPGGGRPGR